MGLTMRRLAAVSAAIVVMSAALAAAVAAAGKPRAWIDQPLPGAILALGPTPVTVHAADDGGIASVRISVDGQPASELPAAGGDLVTVQWSWAAASLGTHLLTVVAVNAAGTPSDPVSVAVTFVARDDLPPTPPPTPSTEPLPTPTLVATPGPTPPPGATPSPTPTPTRTPSPTPSPTPTPTPTPSPTPSPTPTPCPVPAPVNDAPPDGETYYDSVAPEYSWTWSGNQACITNMVLVLDLDQQVNDYDPDWHLEFVLSPSARSYQPDVVLVPDPSEWNGCGFYFWHVEARLADESSEWSAPSQIRVCPPP
jgi:hypothetical protein